MQQAHDFLAESEALAAVLEPLADEGWTQVTQFKGWTLNDVIRHLHFWNSAADMTWSDLDGFHGVAAEVRAAMAQGSMRPVEQTHVRQTGRELLNVWRDLFRQMGPRWAAIDPKERLPWMGPDMSARSMMTARQMETWAHGQEIFDRLGVPQPQAERIKNIVILGMNTFAWSHQVHGLTVPDRVPHVALTAPSGAVWTFGGDESADRISGAAVEFAQVVTQTRNVADTGLAVSGPVATQWMAIAQCFAGGAETPPAPGSRFRRTVL